MLISLPPEKVMAAFYQPDLLKGWWGVERSLIELRPGGLYTLIWEVSKNGIGYVSTGIIKEYELNELLVIEDLVYLNPEKAPLGPMKLSIETVPRGSGTFLTVHQTGYQQGGDWDWYYDAVKDAWPVALTGLKKYLENN